MQSLKVFVAVGLWPLQEGGKVPSTCSDTPFNLDAISTLIPSLNIVSMLLLNINNHRKLIHYVELAG